MAERPESVAAQRLQAFLEQLRDAFGVEAEVIVDTGDGFVEGRMEGEELGHLIGRAGNTIDAIQHLAPRIALKDLPAKVRVAVDIDGYRERRLEVLRAEADEAAAEVERSGEAVELGPLPPLERKAIHDHLRARPGVETESEGEEPERVLVIYPAG
jgi:spoIIIJ-associated protein